MTQSAKQWAAGFFILWLFFVLTSFFVVQKPFTAANAAAVGNVLLDLLAAGWLLLLGLGIGLWLLRALQLSRLSLAEQLVLGTGLGLGAMGLLAFGLGLAGWFNRPIFYLTTFGLTALALPPVWRLLRQISQRRALFEPRPNRPTLLYLGLFAFLTLLVALLPPTDWDGLFYHLTGPRLYLQAGQVVAGVDIPHLSFPSLMEMLFAWAMLLRGDIAAKLLHTAYGFLLAGLVFGAARKLFGPKAAWPALLILASMPMVATLAGWAYNDLALAFYQLAAIYLVINDQLSMKNERMGESANERIYEAANERIGGFVNDHSQFRAKPPRGTIHNSQLVLGGIFAGLAMGLKYTSFVTPLVIIGLLLWPACRYHASRVTRHVSGATNSKLSTQNYQLKTVFSALVAFALPALLVASPWYLKNWAFTGNPVYPFLYDFFGGLYWDQFRADWYAGGGSGVGWQPATLLALPWLLTLGVRDVNYWDGRTGPLLLLFLPLVLLYGLFPRFLPSHHAARSAGQPPLPSAASLLLVYALAHFLVWTLGVVWSRALWQSRLLLPGLVALAPVSGWVWANLPAFDLPRFSLSRFANLAIALTLGLTLLDIGLLTLRIDPLPYLAGLESRPEYLTRRLGAHYAAMAEIGAQVASPAKVVFLWEPRSYYCPSTCLPDSILDEFPHLVHQWGTAEAIAQQWREAGVTHVLVHQTGLEFMRRERPEAVDLDILAALESQYWQEVFDVAGAYQLYELKASHD